MVSKQPHNITNRVNLNRKTDYLFRVSMKGLVIDSQGKVLVVKETGRTWWDLPGGGMDHEENIKSAIARELAEEVGLTGEFEYKIIAVEDPGFLSGVKVWQLRLVFAVTPQNMHFQPGEDGDEVQFIDPIMLKDSDNSSERRVYEYSLCA